MMVKCKSCGEECRTIIQFEGGADSESIRTATLENNSEQWPKCGQMSTYSKPDYFFR